MSGPIVFALTGLLCLVLAVALVFGAGRVRRRVRASLGWPEAPATITRSEVVSREDDGSVMYEAAIGYRYEADGRVHDGTRVRPGATVSGGRVRAQAITARYPVGARIMARYDPARPDYAVLEPGATGGLQAMWVVAAIFGAIGVAALIAGAFLPG